MDDQINCQRCSNLRFVGLPEGVEGRSPETFLETWLIDTLRREKLSSTIVVECAHCVPMTPGPPYSPPRTFLVKLLNDRNLDTILQLTREVGHLSIQNSNVLDFSVSIQKEQSS